MFRFRYFYFLLRCLGVYFLVLSEEVLLGYDGVDSMSGGSEVGFFFLSLFCVGSWGF